MKVKVKLGDFIELVDYLSKLDRGVSFSKFLNLLIKSNKPLLDEFTSRVNLFNERVDLVKLSYAAVDGSGHIILDGDKYKYLKEDYIKMRKELLELSRDFNKEMSEYLSNEVEIFIDGIDILRNLGDEVVDNFINLYNL